MIENLKEVFDKFTNDFHKFDMIKNPLSKRPDLCALMLLDKLVPGSNDIFAGADHDVVYFDIDQDELAEAATEDDVLYLVRCGVILDPDGFMMFV